MQVWCPGSDEDVWSCRTLHNPRRRPNPNVSSDLWLPDLDSFVRLAACQDFQCAEEDNFEEFLNRHEDDLGARRYDDERLTPVLRFQLLFLHQIPVRDALPWPGMQLMNLWITDYINWPSGTNAGARCSGITKTCPVMVWRNGSWSTSLALAGKILKAVWSYQSTCSFLLHIRLIASSFNFQILGIRSIISIHAISGALWSNPPGLVHSSSSAGSYFYPDTRRKSTINQSILILYEEYGSYTILNFY